MKIKYDFKTWGLVLLFLLSIGTLNSLTAAEETPEKEFRVTNLNLPVGFQAAEQSYISPLKIDMFLLSGDRIFTGEGGSVELATEDGTLIFIDENSEFEIEKTQSKESIFNLFVGRLMAKFAPSNVTGTSYKVKSPVAVAAVRGTELVMAVEEGGETQAGVIEGKVEFGPLEMGDPDSMESLDQPGLQEDLHEDPQPETDELDDQNTSDNEEDIWEETVMVEEDKGIIIKPFQKPQSVKNLPPLVVSAVDKLPNIRERIKSIREQWPKLKRANQISLRQKSIRERIKWKTPPRVKPARRPVPRQNPPPPLQQKRERR